MKYLFNIKPLWFLLILTSLAACQSAEEAEKEHHQAQKTAFLQSIEMIESAGRKLQTANPGSQLVDDALKQLDSGLEQAYKVEDEFLNKIDARLGKVYQRNFLKGVEDYRLGVESGATKQQLKGLMQLQKWSQFWQIEGTEIRRKLDAES